MNFIESLTRFDKGVSGWTGKNLDEELGRLLRDVEDGKVPVRHILIEDIDRLSRQGFWQTSDILKRFIAMEKVLHIGDNLVIDETFLADPIPIINVLMGSTRAQGESDRKSGTCGKAWIGKREIARTQKIPIHSRGPGWTKTVKDKEGKIIKVEGIRVRVEDVQLIFSLCGDYNFSILQIQRELIKRKRTPWGKSGWRRNFIWRILRNRMVLGEYQPYTCVIERKVITGGKSKTKQIRKPIGDPIFGIYPQIISQSVWDRAQAAIAARNLNPRTGERSNNHGGGNRNKENLFGILLQDVTPSSLDDNGESSTMRYRPRYNLRNPARYMTCYTAYRQPNRIQAREFKEAFLPFLLQVDWPELQKQPENPVVEKKCTELETVLTKLDRVDRNIAKVKGFAKNPDVEQATLVLLQEQYVEQDKLKARRTT